MGHSMEFHAIDDKFIIVGETSGWYDGSKFEGANMWSAAMTGDNDILEKCLKAGLNVNYSRWVKDDKVLGTGVRSIADIVTCRNDVKAMRLLIGHAVDLSGTVIATSWLRIRAQIVLLLSGDDRKLVENDPWTTPLHLACRYGYMDLLRILLDEGRADPNLEDCQSRTGLHRTIIGTGTLDVAKLLLDRGAAVDAKDKSGLTPLALAALLNKLELVEMLLDHGAAIDATDSRGETALYKASLRNHSAVVAALAARGAQIDLRNSDGISAFFKAASSLKTDIMDILTDCGGDTDSRDSNGCTALARATMAKNIPLITHLLQLGVDIDAEDSDGWTPLFAAMIHNDEHPIHLLLTYGSNVRKADNHDNTTLHQAAVLGATFVARHILAGLPRNHINHSQMNVYGETPMTIACKHNNSPIVKVLLKHGANPHHVDPNGYRSLDRAMYWGSYACIRLLLEAGAGIDSRTLFALQQGKHDNPDDTANYDMIILRLKSQYSMSDLPTATTPSRLNHLFARTMTRDNLRARMWEKQGKSALALDRSKDERNEEVEEVLSSDPFEACIPKPPPSQIINNNTIKENKTRSLENGVEAALDTTNAAVGL